MESRGKHRMELGIHATLQALHDPGIGKWEVLCFQDTRHGQRQDFPMDGKCNLLTRSSLGSEIILGRIRRPPVGLRQTGLPRDHPRDRDALAPALKQFQAGMITNAYETGGRRTRPFVTSAGSKSEIEPSGRAARTRPLSRTSRPSKSSAVHR